MQKKTDGIVIKFLKLATVGIYDTCTCVSLSLSALSAFNLSAKSLCL